MRLFADENIPLLTVHELRQKGHEVFDIRGTDDQGIDDESLWDKVQTLLLQCVSKFRLFVTVSD